MKYGINMLLISALLIGLTSCGSVPASFTQNTRTKYDLSAEDLRSLQFYVSNDIVLTRYSREDKKATQGGELTLLKDEVLERIVIRSGTPCLVHEVIDGNRIAFSFEDGASRYLVFGNIRNQDGRYTLQALDWKNEKGGLVNYGEKEYYASPESREAYIYLMVKSLERFKMDQKVVKGKTLN
ncbi:MAG: hypothetical protein RL090_1425 [Bacteroidota bacterium]|jgi:hypothetical protein